MKSVYLRWLVFSTILAMCVISWKSLIYVDYFPRSESHHEFDVPYDDSATCSKLDINESQIYEIKSFCPENFQSIDVSKFIVICNVKPVSTSQDTNSTLILSRASAKLRNKWSNNPPLSRYAKLIEDHQSNCTQKVATHYMDIFHGIGSHLSVWSQAMCNAMEEGYRLRMYNPEWVWLDVTFCDKEEANKSPLLCYLPRSEFRCGCDEVPPELNISNPRNKKRTGCALLKLKQGGIVQEFRAASTEYLFQQVSPLVVQEAERQVGILFGPGGTPDDLITVHIRWGDKYNEMPNRKLVSISSYVEAISTLLHDRYGHNQTANIYLATEDPVAFQELQSTVPVGWTIYYDRTVEELSRFRPLEGNSAYWTSKNSKGRAGLASFASMLVAMEAKLFVLTTRSNWSRIINHLRTNIIDPRCNGCTRMVDLVSGIW
jgi:hypothetical protein